MAKPSKSIAECQLAATDSAIGQSSSKPVEMLRKAEVLRQDVSRLCAHLNDGYRRFVLNK